MVTLKADQGLFGRMVIMAQACNFDMWTLFSHCLGPIPWSLAGADDTLVEYEGKNAACARRGHTTSRGHPQ